jgi:hypothetical protein
MFFLYFLGFIFRRARAPVLARNGEQRVNLLSSLDGSRLDAIWPGAPAVQLAGCDDKRHPDSRFMARGLRVSGEMSECGLRGRDVARANFTGPGTFGLALRQAWSQPPML